MDAHVKPEHGGASGLPTVFVAWNRYQRRVEAFREPLNAHVAFLYYEWENRSRLHKTAAYFGKAFNTVAILRRKRPAAFYVQAPPIFAVYTALVYHWIFRTPFVVDAHNSMIYGSKWCRMPLVRFVLNHATLVLVHNEDVKRIAEHKGIRCRVLMDRPADVKTDPEILPNRFAMRNGRPRVVVPCSYGADEPLDAMREATTLLPEIDFFLTYTVDKLPADYVAGFSENTIFTGFLPVETFNSLLASADAILVLSTRDGTQPSGASEALAFSRPLVVSDQAIIRRLFPRGAVYTDNTAPAIARAIGEALDNRERLAAEMAAFKQVKLDAWQAEYEALEPLMFSGKGEG